METVTKTIKGWANTTGYLFNENVVNDKFKDNLEKYKKENLKGFKELSCFDTLRGKNAKKVVKIYGWYWRGNWADPTKELVTTFYK